MSGLHCAQLNHDELVTIQYQQPGMLTAGKCNWDVQCRKLLLKMHTKQATWATQAMLLLAHSRSTSQSQLNAMTT